MQYRLPFVLTLAAIGAAGVFAVACSSTPATDDAGAADTSTPDTSMVPDGGGPIDMNAKDTSMRMACANNPMMGSCDVVSQNCTMGQECVAQSYPDGGDVISCQKASTGAITEGDTCTAGANNPCVAGLVCVNNRCSQPCCPDSPGAATGDSTICGMSKEGYPGVCDLQISDAKGKAMFMVCEYNPPCEPFGIQPCASGSECAVRDPAGTATCETIVTPPGKAEHAACTYANDCMDGMLCTGKCQIVCYHASSSSPPFDAGALQLTTPLKGGCPGNTACPAGNVMNMPTWLGLCP